MAENKIDILLVDDHAIVREGYRSLLSKQPGLSVVGEAGNANQAYQCFKEFQPDLVITDISLPGSSGIDLIDRIKQRDHSARILVFSMHQHPGFAAQALQAGTLGYVSKSSEPEELLRAIAAVYRRQHYLSADVAQALALEKLGQDYQALNALSVREFEILRLLVGGVSHDDIAALLNISSKTAGNCHYQIKRKLGVSTDIELTRLAIKLNVLDLLGLA